MHQVTRNEQDIFSEEIFPTDKKGYKQTIFDIIEKKKRSKVEKKIKEVSF